MARAPLELELGAQFDHQVVNDDLPRAVAEVNTIVSRYLQIN
jgi:guanylate kinase